jgi:GH24 family phage-related lysozyme (muramidase)
MRTSRNGQATILSHEGIVLSAYKDAVGVWTIGAGVTAAAGVGAVYKGQTITLAKALEQFADRVLPKYEKRVEQACPKLVTHQNDALVSFDYNTGKIISGSVDDKIRAGNFKAAMQTLKQYNKGGGRVLAGLTKRRIEEANLFERGTYPQIKGVPVWDRYPGKSRLVTLEALGVSRTAESVTLPNVTAELVTAKIAPVPAVAPAPAPASVPVVQPRAGLWCTVLSWFTA